MITVNEYVQKCAERIKAGTPFISYWCPFSTGVIYLDMTKPRVVKKFRDNIRHLSNREDVRPMYIVTSDGYYHSVEEKSIKDQMIHDKLRALIDEEPV